MRVQASFWGLALVALCLGCGHSGAPNTYDAIQVSITPAQPVVTEEDTITLQATVTSGKGLGVNWSIQEEAGGTITSSGVYTAPATLGTYHVIATSAENPKKSCTMAIAVVAAPSIDRFTATPTLLTPGSAAQLQGAFTGGTGSISPTVGAVVSGQNYPVSPTTSTTYILTVTNAAGKQATSSVDISLPPVIQSLQATPATLTLGQSSVLTPVFTNGTGSLDNGVGAVLSGQSYPVTPTASTTYTLTVTGTSGTTPATQTVTVTLLPPASIGTFSALPSTLYPGQSSTLTPVFVGGTGSIDHGVGTVVSGQTYPVSPLNTTTYTLTVTDPQGAQVQSTTTVTLRAHGSFSATGPIGTPRKYHVGTSLQDGSVLITGGLPKEEADNNGVAIPALNGAERFTPATGRFAPVGLMTSPRYGHSACRLADGRVLITGGNQTYDPLAPDPVSIATNSAEIFDPTTGTFTATGSMSAPRRWHTSTLLPNGTVLVAGGIQGNGTDTFTILSSAEIFDPVSGTFSNATAMSTPRQMHQAVALQDGSILLLGGVTYSGTAPAVVPLGILSAERFIPGSPGTFQATATSLATGRGLPTALRLSSGQVIVAGGLGASGSWLSSMELYSPSSNGFALTTSLVNASPAPVAALLGDGRVAVFGQGEAEVFDPNTLVATALQGLGLPSRTFLTATLVPISGSSTGQVLVVDLDGASLFDPLNP